MGNTQSTSSFFQKALEGFILSNPFLQKKEFTKRAFIAALIFLSDLSRSDPEGYKETGTKVLLILSGRFIMFVLKLRHA